MSTLPKKARTKPAGRALRRSPAPRSHRQRRAVAASARREAILNAALDEFSARGFAAARLDDVARRAGVAKGTIYLYFADKEALFQELVRFQLNPIVGVFEKAFASDMPLRALIDQAIEIFVTQIYGTHRKLVMRLIISEGPRFPTLAEFYYREVLSRILGALRTRLVRALDRGEIADDTLVRFPQLIGAASVVAIVWHGLFDHYEPLDVRALLRAYFDRLFAAGTTPL